ncbi:MAG: peptidoglycan DD-metalloendopeptidase family protein [Hyphomicrobium sp.]|nr:MAG: peptidoglycan DD-metalloendopeptidase family protein [Hyphomicrobium sp.]MBZ0209471.1 peptidoglycan DD-metalloendopeptidase family protein [Hyphomicrobium sp.]
MLVLAPSAWVFAQTPSNADDAKKKLESKRNELQDVEKKTKSLQSDVEGLAAERERLNTRLVETADLIKKSEAQLTSIETRIGELEEQQRILKGSLNQRHDQIAKLLSALQRMGRNPPPVLITQREDALEMVRSAMLLSAAFPELGNQAKALTARLNELIRVMTEIRTQGDQLRNEMTRLNDARTRLSGLMEEKRVTLEERQSELQRMRAAAADISRNVNDLNELITQLDQAVKNNTGLGAYEEQRKQAAAANITPNSSAPIPPNSPAALPANQKAPPPDALVPPATSKGIDVVVLSPGAMLGSPGRIKPEIAFSDAAGRLPMPAQGRQVLGFGEKTQFGGQSKGIVLETRQGAQVTSPCDGWIVYAGEFRSYGQLLIINAGGGYHVLLAGLSQIDVQPGQFVLAAEPVGTMSGWSQQSQPAAANSAPVLYVEFRKDGRPVDPDPWWVAGHRKVQG